MANANLDFSGLTVTRTFTFPDATGTIALTSGSTSIITVGTITTGVWHGTLIGLQYGGTGANLSATGGASNVVMQTSSGGAFTVAQLALADLSDAADVATVTYVDNTIVFDPLVTTGDPSFDFGGSAAPSHVIVADHAGTVATATLTLANGSFGGQVVFFAVVNTITALTLTGSFDTTGLAQPTTAVGPKTFGWVWSADLTGWVRFL